ncbi:MAG: outer membrane beta-barrel domain-containing protein, partial [Pseudobdellovibrionaceae bacterium]
MRSFRFVFLFITFALLGSLAFADDLDDIEAELDKKAPPAQGQPAPLPPSPSSPQGKAEAAQDAKMTDFAGLGRLAPFSEIAVLQRRYLPRTGRFEMNANLSTITNDPFFMSAGAAFRFGYNFTEAWGIEGNYTSVSTSQRQVTKSLKDRGVQTSSLVTPKSYMGLDLKWSPSYGKMSYLNKSIVPFDMYFALGAGTTTTNTNEA